MSQLSKDDRTLKEWIKIKADKCPAYGDAFWHQDPALVNAYCNGCAGMGGLCHKYWRYVKERIHHSYWLMPKGYIPKPL